MPCHAMPCHPMIENKIKYRQNFYNSRVKQQQEEEVFKRNKGKSTLKDKIACSVLSCAASLCHQRIQNKVESCTLPF